jgi:hypothetical protein
LFFSQKAQGGMNERIILFCNTMFGAPLEAPENIPAGFLFTHDRRLYPQAVAVVFHLPAWKYGRRFLLPYKKPGQLWVGLSMECDENCRIQKDASFTRRFDLTMTYRLNSDVPVPYFGEYLREALRIPPRVKLIQPIATAFVSSRINQSGRRQYLRELSRWMPVDFYGKFMRNNRLPNDQGRASKNEVLAQYKFTLAFENACGVDYVTEKFYDPLCFGSVPVYLGAPNIADFAPGQDCFINAKDFSRPKDLADYLIMLDHDAGAYEKYLEWKNRPYLESFERLLTLAKQHPFVQLCERIQRLLEGKRKEPESASL